MPTTQHTRKSNRQYFSRAVWEKHVADFRASGLTQPEYAKLHGLVLTTFHSWIRRIRCDQQETAQTFMPVKVNMASLQSIETDNGLPQDIHITLPNGIQCTFPSNHAPKLILPWIEYLRVLP